MCILTDIKYLLKFLSWNGRNGNDDLIDIIEISALNDPVSSADNTYTLNIFAPLVRIIINDTFDGHCVVIALDNILNDNIGSFTRTYDHYRFGIFVLLSMVLGASQKSVWKSACKYKRNEQNQIKEIIGFRLSLMSGNSEKLKSHCRNTAWNGTAHYKVL